MGNLGMYASGIPVGMLIDAKGPRWGVALGIVFFAAGYYPIAKGWSKTILKEYGSDTFDSLRCWPWGLQHWFSVSLLLLYWSWKLLGLHCVHQSSSAQFPGPPRNVHRFPSGSLWIECFLLCDCCLCGTSRYVPLSHAVGWRDRHSSNSIILLSQLQYTTEEIRATPSA